MLHYRTKNEIKDLVFYPDTATLDPKTMNDVVDLGDIHLDIGSTLGIEKILIDFEYNSWGKQVSDGDPQRTHVRVVKEFTQDQFLLLSLNLGYGYFPDLDTTGYPPLPERDDGTVPLSDAAILRVKHMSQAVANMGHQYTDINGDPYAVMALFLGTSYDNDLKKFDNSDGYCALEDIGAQFVTTGGFIPDMFLREYNEDDTWSAFEFAWKTETINSVDYQVVYQSKVNSNTGNPLTDPTKWRRVPFLGVTPMVTLTDTNYNEPIWVTDNEGFVSYKPYAPGWPFADGAYGARVGTTEHGYNEEYNALPDTGPILTAPGDPTLRYIPLPWDKFLSRFFSRFGAWYNLDETPKYFPGDPEPIVGTWFNPANTEAADPRMESVPDRVPLYWDPAFTGATDDFNAWIPGTTANSGAEAGSSFTIGAEWHSRTNKDVPGYPDGSGFPPAYGPLQPDEVPQVDPDPVWDPNPQIDNAGFLPDYTRPEYPHDTIVRPVYLFPAVMIPNFHAGNPVFVGAPTQNPGDYYKWWEVTNPGIDFGPLERIEDLSWMVMIKFDMGLDSEDYIRDNLTM